MANAPLLCDVEHVTTMEPLWRIAMNASSGTGVLVKSPHMTLVSDENGTNIDRTIVALFGESKDSSSATFPFRVTVENGTVELR